MRNNAFIACITTLVAGIFGFFLRWLQTINGFEENGLAIPGAATAIVFAAYSVLAVLVFALVVRFALRKNELSPKAAEALHVPNVLHVAAMWAVAALMAIACLVLMFGSDYARFPTMQRMMAALGIFSALCLPFMLNRKAEGDDKGVGAIASLLPILFGCLWLVTAYRVESENPVLWSYVIEILAIIGVTMSFYYLAAFFYGRSKPGRCLVMLQTTVYLCLCTLMDEHSGAEKLLFGAVAAALLVFQFVLMCNLREKERK